MIELCLDTLPSRLKQSQAIYPWPCIHSPFFRWMSAFAPVFFAY